MQVPTPGPGQEEAVSVAKGACREFEIIAFAASAHLPTQGRSILTQEHSRTLSVNNQGGYSAGQPPGVRDTATLFHPL